MPAPLVIDIAALEDFRDAVHRAVQSLAENRITVLPSDTVYCLAAGGLHAEAALKIAQLRGENDLDPPVLAVKSLEEARDYLPKISRMAERLARRCWPGPLVLELSDSHPDSLLQRLPPEVRDIAVRNERVRVTVPHHGLLAAILRLSPGPLLLWPACRPGEAEPITAAESQTALGGAAEVTFDDGRTRFAQGATIVGCRDGELHVIRAGVVTESALKQFRSFMIAVVCTGNTCRSPMGEVLLKKRIADRLGCKSEELEDRGVMILSAGVNASGGSRASAEAVHVMRQRGIDLSQHESQGVSDRLVRMADLILTMTRGHRDLLLQRWPEARDRTFLMSQERADVADPIGGPIEAYARCADQIDGYIGDWLDRIAEQMN